MLSWDGLVDRYVRTCETRGLATATIEHRASELSRFGRWLKGRKPRPKLDEVDSDLVVRFIGERSAFRARATVSGIVSDLRGMGEFLVDEGVWSRNCLRWIRGPKVDVRRHLPRRIGAENLRALWGAAQGLRQEHSRYLGLCLLSVLYGTGIRAGELRRLDVSDWDPSTATLRIDGRKANRERAVVVGEGVWRCIEAYLPRRHNRLEESGRVGEPALFVSQRGNRLKDANVRSFLRRLSRAASTPHVTMHQFRHSCASDLLEAGVTLPEVQRILGHASIQSTVRYVDVADPLRAVAMEKHPINGILRGAVR